MNKTEYAIVAAIVLVIAAVSGIVGVLSFLMGFAVIQICR